MSDPALEARIAALEAELHELKRQRLQHLGRTPKALDGIRVLDLSRYIFGPFCTQMLADMGADVIKIEPRETGDPARQAGFVQVHGDSASFLARNRNKRSLAVDLRKPEGQEIIRRLVPRCDVVIHNFRPGVMARLGLEPQSLRRLNPSVIYCSLSGYGQEGPHAERPGQDLLVQGMSGIMSTTGWEGGPPVAVGTYLADVTGALTAAYGVVTALQSRSRYGVGQEVEISLLDAMIALQSMEATVFLNSGSVPPRSGSGHWMISQPYGVFATQDKWLALNAHSDQWWRRLCAVPEFADLSVDPRFAERESRRAHGEELVALLEKILRTRTRDDWLAYLATYDVLCAPVYDYAELFADPQVRLNGMVVEQTHPEGGPIKVVGLPVKLSGTPGGSRRPCSRAGGAQRGHFAVPGLRRVGHPAVARTTYHLIQGKERRVGFKMVLLPPNTQADWPDKIRAAVPDCEVNLFDSPDAAREAIVDADAAYGDVVPDLLKRAKRLRWIQAPAAAPPAGYYTPELIDNDVVVTNQREIYNDHIGAHIMAFVLAFARGLHHYIPSQILRQWRPRAEHDTVHLPEATALIVGVGGIGNEAGRLCAAFGMTVLGVDARRPEAPPSMKEMRPPDALHDMLPQADFVILTVPHTPETEGLMGKAEFRAMRKSAFLINIGRGACVKLEELVAASAQRGNRRRRS